MRKNKKSFSRHELHFCDCQWLLWCGLADFLTIGDAISIFFSPKITFRSLNEAWFICASCSSSKIIDQLCQRANNEMFCHEYDQIHLGKNQKTFLFIKMQRMKYAWSKSNKGNSQPQANAIQHWRNNPQLQNSNLWAPHAEIWFKWMKFKHIIKKSPQECQFSASFQSLSAATLK